MASENQEIDAIQSWEDTEENNDVGDGFKNLIAPTDKNLENKSNGNISSDSASVKIILGGEGDSLRSQCVSPEPTCVTILKRPSGDVQSSNDSKVIQPKKTLQQREQEYAKARLRILGEPGASGADKKKSGNK